jgi:hypothetical protein
MKLNLTLLVSLSLSVVQAYIPPADRADGMYSFSFSANGSPLTKLHDEALALPPSAKFRRSVPALTSPASLETRSFPSQQVNCGTRDISNHKDYSVVQNCLSTWLDKWTDET